MLKLYRFTDNNKEYWETWENKEGTHTVHWGDLGTTGQTKEVKSSLLKKAEPSIQREIGSLVAQGFSSIDDEDQFTTH